MDLTQTAFGAWNGGRFMHYGEPLSDERFIALVQHSYERGVRTFLTADVYGAGEADRLIGTALAGVPRESYCLIGMVGHDFYTGQREGAKGYPRFTHASLRGPEGYASYLQEATERSLERCRTGAFDLLMLHNPDRTGYTHAAIWDGLAALKDRGLTAQLGLAPGPANGFTLDLLSAFTQQEKLIDWAMIILNPFEPWPGRLVLSAAEKHGIKLLARVVDYGGIFHDDVKPGHVFAQWDHRSYRPAGWVEAAQAKVEPLRPIAKKYGLSLLQLASVWTLNQPAMKCVVPTLIQEIGEGARAIEAKLDDLAGVPDLRLTDEELALIAQIGDNTGCMKLKGAHPQHQGDDLPDNWALDAEAHQQAQTWNIVPERDLAYTM
jgi:aryl-alcohol dehydrogenase-like predicted oxidoreductase